MIWTLTLLLIVLRGFNSINPTGNSVLTISRGYRKLRDINMNFVNPSISSTLSKNLKGEIKMIDDISEFFNFFYELRLSNSIVLCPNKKYLDYATSYFSNILSVIVPTGIIINKSQMESVPIFEISLSEYDLLNYYAVIAEMEYETLTGTIEIIDSSTKTMNLYHSIALLSGVGLNFLISVAYFLRSCFIKPKYYFNLHSMLNRISQIVILQLLVTYYIYLYNNKELFGIDFQKVIIIFSTFLFSFYKSILLVLLITLSTGWSVLYFKDITTLKIKSYSIAFFLTDSLIEIAIIVLVNHFGLKDQYEFLMQYSLTAIEFGILLIWVVFSLFKSYRKLRKQCKYETEINSCFACAYQSKKRTMKIFYFFSFTYALIHIAYPPLSQVYFKTGNLISFKVGEMVFESICILILLLIYFPRKLPKHYLINRICLKTQVFSAEVYPYFVNNFQITTTNLKQCLVEKLPIVITNPYYGITSKAKNDEEIASNSVFNNMHIGYCLSEEEGKLKLNEIL